jgi:hypothetical protein
MVDAIRFGALVGSCVLLASAGCSQFGPSCDTSDDGNPADHYNEGAVTNGTYMSTPYTGPLLMFEGGKRYYLHHKLGCTPQMIQMFESFTENGLSAGTMAPCAGNMCELQRVDQTGILVKNDTCSDFYLLVVASSPNCALNLDGGDDHAATDAAADAAPDVTAQ